MQRLPHTSLFRRILFGSLFVYSLTLSSQNSPNSFQKSTPEEEGISSQAILDFVESLEQKIDAVHSFMLIRHGKQIAQGWWAPYDAPTPHLMHSLSKSFTSTAIGLAVGEGKLSLNDQVISFFPKYIPDSTSYNLDAMRIRDLITMNTGHMKEPWALGEENWVKFFLSQEVPLKPGTHFKYNSMATYMLSAIIQEVTGEQLVAYLEPRLFQPLGIPTPYWDTCPMGIHTGGWGLRIRTEDIAKLGQLYLQKGVWNGKRILSEEWVEMASSKQTSNGSNPDSDWEQGYGFQFWRCRHNAYRGDGAMGQFCIVIPDHDAVIAITAGTNDMGGIMQVVWDQLLPEMKAEALPANRTVNKLLERKTQDLTLDPVVGEADNPLSKKLRKITYNLEENKEGVNGISFHLGKKEPYLSILMDHGEEIIPIGWEMYEKSRLKQYIPHVRNVPSEIAASGAWTDPQTYQLKMYLVETPARMTYSFHFEGNKLTWKTELEHSLFGPREPEVLSGFQIQN
ncbi:MAG: serine hydrolase [Bacteroidota bacterium]